MMLLISFPMLVLLGADVMIIWDGLHFNLFIKYSFNRSIWVDLPTPSSPSNIISFPVMFLVWCGIMAVLQQIQRTKQMKKQFIGIDRDGCLVGNLGDYKNNSPSQYFATEMPLILPTINKLKKIGLPVVIFSNQAGIESGYTTLEKVASQFCWLIDKLKEYDVQVLYGLFCPDKAGSECIAVDSWGSDVYDNKIVKSSYRKPDKGMGELLMKHLLSPYFRDKLNTQYECKFYIGDLSGKPGYAPGCAEPDSDLRFAKNMRWDYLDIQDFLVL